MGNLKLLNIIGRAFAYGEIDELQPLLADNCEYKSDYSGKVIESSDAIIEFIKGVNEAVVAEGIKYRFRPVLLYVILRNAEKLRESDDTDLRLNNVGLLLYKDDDRHPVAVVTVYQNVDDELIAKIHLSRDSSVYNVEKYAREDEAIAEDSPDDIPSTVEPFTSREKYIKEFGGHLSYQDLDAGDICEDGLYIWRKADEYFRDWLESCGYNLEEATSFDDCIGYKCIRRRVPYTIYMYAYGQKRTAELDGEYCEKWLDHEYSKDRKVLVVYLSVKKTETEQGPVYEVGSYGGDMDSPLEPWAISYINEKPVLEYYPRKEMMDISDDLMYAFNHDDLDVYESIVVKDNPWFIPVDGSGRYLNSAFFTVLQNVHAEYGDMKRGYVRFNDAVYCSVPYIDDYGFFSFSVDRNTDRITEVTAFPFEGGEREVAEFIKTEERENCKPFINHPNLLEVEVLSPIESERFSLKLLYDNDECIKYVLPVSKKEEKDDAVRYDYHVFSDGIWQSAKKQDHWPSEIEGYSDRRSVITFKNGYVLSGIEAYRDGTSYSEPEMCGEVIYENEEFVVKREWRWDVGAIHKDDETGLLRVLIRGLSFNFGGVSTFASIEGKRICSLEFMTMSSFKEELCYVAVEGVGYGFVDKDMNFVIPMKYERAEDFWNGMAKVEKNGNWIVINKDGKEIVSETAGYEEVGEFSEGMCKVSTLRLGIMDIAYHSDHSEIAGKWGYIDENGEEIVAPQYIYANDFDNGIAIVCKGEWTIDEKWDNEYNSGRYWTEEEIWGAIDKNGDEIIPFVFDEIRTFFDTNDVYAAHYGGWDSGHWGVIDNHGRWLVKPIFESIGDDYHDGMITFYGEDSDYDALMGIYDIRKNKVLFEPQFEDVSFLEDGWISVEAYDKEADRVTEKLINRKGKEKFKSEYSSIYTWKTPYEVVIRSDDGDRHGLINPDGTEVLPCEHDVPWNGIHPEIKRITFREGNKEGMKDFDGNIIIPADYYELRYIDEPLIVVRADGESDCHSNRSIVRDGEHVDYYEGMITHEGDKVLPAVFEEIRWLDDEYFVSSRNGCSEMYRLIKKNE